MADGTRSQESNRQLEEGINSLLKVHRDALKKGIASLRTLVLETQGRSNSFSPHQSEHGQGSQGRNYSQNPTRFSGLEFPKFNGDDFRGWLYKGEQFFGIDETAPDSKVKIAAMHMEGRALQWHRVFLKSRFTRDLPTWEEYVRAIAERFSEESSKEDNQWIKDFSGKSGGLEFSSGAAFSCSIPRSNNVWSEATWLETVEVLLKSVGQEELVHGESAIQNSDGGGELPSLTKQMDDSIENVKDANSVEVMPEFLGIDQNPDVDDGQDKHISEAQRADQSAYGPSGTSSEEGGQAVTKVNLQVEMSYNENQKETCSIVNESLRDQSQDDTSIPVVKVQDADSLVLDASLIIRKTNDQIVASDLCHENATALTDGSVRDHDAQDEFSVNGVLVDNSKVLSGNIHRKTIAEDIHGSEKGNSHILNEKFDTHGCADVKSLCDEYGNLHEDLMMFEKTGMNGILGHNWIDDRGFTGAVFDGYDCKKRGVIVLAIERNGNIATSWAVKASGFKGGTIQMSCGYYSSQVVYGQPAPAHICYVPDFSVVDMVDRSLTVREALIHQLKHHLSLAQQHMKIQADKHRSDRPFSVGDWVYVKLQYREHSLKTNRCQKLSPRYFGSFQVKARVGAVAYKLDLPLHAKIQDTFHVSLLKRKAGSQVVSSHLPPSINDQGQLLLELMAILDRRLIKRGRAAVTQVLVQGSYSYMDLLARFDFPRLNDDDFRDWFYKCERFFDVEQTPPDMKVRLAVMHLEGRALKWHGVFMKARLTREIPSWEEYIKALEARFGNSAYIESMSNSMGLWKQDSIQNFQKPFEVSNKNSSGINHLQRSSMILFSQSHKSGEKFEIEEKQLVFDKSPDREEQPTSEVPKVSNTCYKIGRERQSHSLDSHEIELEDFYKFFRGSDSVQQDNDLVVGAVVSGNENRIDVNVGTDLLGTMLTKEVLPLYHKEMSYLLCEVEMDAEETMVNGKVGIVKNDAAVSGEAMPGRPVVEPGTILFAEVLGRTLSGRLLLSTRRLFKHLAWHRVRQIKQLNEPIMVKVTEWNTGGLFSLSVLTEVKLTVVTTQVFKGWAEVVTKFRGGTLQYSELPL